MLFFDVSLSLLFRLPNLFFHLQSPALSVLEILLHSHTSSETYQKGLGEMRMLCRIPKRAFTARLLELRLPCFIHHQVVRLCFYGLFFVFTISIYNVVQLCAPLHVTFIDHSGTGVTSHVGPTHPIYQHKQKERRFLDGLSRKF